MNFDGSQIAFLAPTSAQHPWGEGSTSNGWSGSADVPYCEWQSTQNGVYGYNGFSFLTIADIPNPAPRNNHFWHIRRKLLIDAFAQHPDRVGNETGGLVCDAATNEYYDYSDSSFNVVNMWVSGLPNFNPSPGGLTGSKQLFMTTCNGGVASRGTQSAVELQPELMPNEYYTFAVERNLTGYTMEVSGNFARAGVQTIRLYRPFEVDGEPIWHYNVKAEEYDGRHNADLKQENWAFGSSEWLDQWPAGSAFPDSFVIGDLYTNAYEGIATLTDIRYFEAKSTEEEVAVEEEIDEEQETVVDAEQGEQDVSCERVVFMTSMDILESGERLISQTGNLYLDLQPNANLQLWRGSPETSGVLLWESMANEPVNMTYFTELQGDGNLITYSTGLSERSIVWMTQSVGPANGTVFSLALDCAQNGGNLSIFVGPPQASDEVVWTIEVDAGPPTPAPTLSPLPVDPPVQTTSCKPTIFMTSGDFLYPGKRVIDYEKGVHLIQLANGNVEIRKGTPELPGDLMWESGFIGDPEYSYYTKFEVTSNLITWMVQEDHTFSPVWETGTYRPTTDSYYLTVDCTEKDNRIAIYQGNPEENGLLVWKADSQSDTDPVSIPKPTAPPTDSPSQMESTNDTPSAQETVEPSQLAPVSDLVPNPGAPASSLIESSEGTTPTTTTLTSSAMNHSTLSVSMLRSLWSIALIGLLSMMA